jgi:hypothetical protein
MEFLLLWWDELDDLTHACRHVATCAFEEVVTVSEPLIRGASVAGTWILLQSLSPYPLNFS